MSKEVLARWHAHERHEYCTHLMLYGRTKKIWKIQNRGLTSDTSSSSEVAAKRQMASALG